MTLLRSDGDVTGDDAAAPAAPSPDAGSPAGYRFDAELWLHGGDAAWCFVTVPEDVSDDIEARTAEHRRGFGSVRVRVNVGETTWATSVFPDSKRGAYVLPVKKEVRSRESLEVGDRLAVTLSVLDG